MLILVPVKYSTLYVFTTIVYRQQMNRVLLSQLEQLKCNFCTQWFSVHSEFASLQKYSLNACHKCLENFKYRLVDPTSYEIYDVVLIKTGIELTNKQHQLTNKFQAYIKMHRDSSNLSEQTSLLLKEEDMRNSDLKAEINMYAQPIKERVSETCRKFLDGLIKNWNDILTQIQSGSLKFDQHRQNVIKILSDRYYNFAKDPQNLLSQSRIKQGENMLKQIAEQIKNITSDKMIGKLKNFVGDFFGLNKENQNCMNGIENKQNKTPNQKRNLRNIRQKLIRNSRVQSNQLKINCSNVKSMKSSSIKSNIKSSKKDFGKSSKKNLLKPEPLFLKKQSSQKNLSSIKTARSYRIQIEPDQQKEKPTFAIDEYRDKMSRLLKEQNMIDSYMPIQPQKNDSVIDRTYGQKCLVQYLVELKMKTALNDNICQLINENLAKGDILCYLKSLQWRSSISLIRFVKVKMHDAEFDHFLNWFRDKYFVQILVITNNFLTQLSVQAIYAFCCRHPEMNLKHIYMGNNYIKPSKVRKTIQELRSLGIYLYL